MKRAVKKLTDKQTSEVETLAACLTTAQMADYFGISRRTFFNMLKKDDHLNALYKKGNAKAIADIGGSLIFKARNGDTTSQIFYLKTRAGWKETKDEDKEVKDNNININIVSPDAS